MVERKFYTCPELNYALADSASGIVFQPSRWRGKVKLGVDVWRTSNYETFFKRFLSIFQTQLRATERCVERNPDNQYDLVRYSSAEIFGNQLLGCLSELNDLGRSNRDSTPPPSFGTRPCGLGGKRKADEPARRIAYTPLVVPETFRGLGLRSSKGI